MPSSTPIRGVLMREARTLAAGGLSAPRIAGLLLGRHPGLNSAIAQDVAGLAAGRAGVLERISEIFQRGGNLGSFINIARAAGCDPKTKMVRVTVIIPLESETSRGKLEFYETVDIPASGRIGQIFGAAIAAVARRAAELGYAPAVTGTASGGVFGDIRFGSFECL